MNKSNRVGLEKKGLLFLVVLLIFPAACTVYENPPPDSFSAADAGGPAGMDDPGYVEIRDDSDFYEPLNSYGRWEEVDSYGRCWIPGHVDRDWRPYSSGHWERTDAGWYWDSDEPWGWATYHYGRWDHSDRVGWYWVPQTQWAPAWVSWHQGGGYVGWAPLRPSRSPRGNVSIDVTVRDEAPARSYVFVHEKEFLQPVRPSTVVVNNTTIINQTTNITNVKVVNKTVINEGPHTEVIERATGQKIQTVPVRTVRREKETRVAAPHRAPANNQPQPPRSPTPKNAPTHAAQPQTAPASRPVPVIPPPPPTETRERNHTDEPGNTAREHPVPSSETRSERKPEPNIEKSAPTTPAIPKERSDKPAPKVEKPRKPAPKVEKPPHTPPGQAKHETEKREEEKRDKASENDQPSK